MLGRTFSSVNTCAIDPNADRDFELWKLTRGFKRQPLQKFPLLRSDGMMKQLRNSLILWKKDSSLLNWSQMKSLLLQKLLMMFPLVLLLKFCLLVEKKLKTKLSD